jgi:hypothetical protein
MSDPETGGLPPEGLVVPAADPITATPSAAEQAIAELEAWFVSHIHDSAISIKTDLFNRVQALKNDLKAFLFHLDA